jgi:hypothetical protein
VPREIDPTLYECDCGHLSYFGTDTVRGVKALSTRNKRKTALLEDDDEQHMLVFKKGKLANIVCPKVPAEGRDAPKTERKLPSRSRMHGTFNGVRLKGITSKITDVTSGRRRTTFRILGKLVPELEPQLRLNTPGLMILASEEIEGTIVRYSADAPGGFYEITIESKE